jgi:hypothetical protein
MAMTLDQFKQVYPLIADWIAATVRNHASESATVGSVGSKRLPLYLGAELLARAKFIPVTEPPVPPFSEWGLTEFADFERRDPDGVAYLDTYFIRGLCAMSERLS